MRKILIASVLSLASFCAVSQQLLLLDRFNGKKVINDSTVTVFSSDIELPELTQYFVMQNTTDRELTLYLRKTVIEMNDSTTDYFCFGIKCWPDTDTTDVPCVIPAGHMDSTFAAHACHVRRFDRPPMQPGLSSITYTIYDNTTFPEPVTASVTVKYHLSGVGIEDNGTWGHGDKGTGGLLAVYPNPANAQISLRTDEIPGGKYQLAIFNSAGRQVESAGISLDGAVLTLPVSALPPGLYFGQIISEKQKAYSFRFQVIR
jgi:hypothetical protein